LSSVSHHLNPTQYILHHVQIKQQPSCHRELLETSWEGSQKTAHFFSSALIIISKVRASRGTATAKQSDTNISVSHYLIDRYETNSHPIRSLTSAIVTLCVGREQRLFAAHEDVLSHSPYLGSLCRNQFFETTKRIDLPDDEPEIFSCVLEYLYKGDYYPRLEFDKRRQSWQLEDGANPERQGTVESTVFVNGVGVVVLKDTVIYVRPPAYQLISCINQLTTS
jgi:hypothetical protein